MSKQIIAGGVAIGGGAPVTIQSMCNTHTEDAKATIAQIHALEEAGCEIVRVTVPNMEAAHALSEIKENISIPLVADIHFDYRLAVEAAARGAKEYGLRSQLLHAYRLEFPENCEGDIKQLSGKIIKAPVPALFEQICKAQGVM